ncbi:hypothetical protein JVT61DRAFT_6452 [Boletus reticuloceps]|uniref:Uncharacterized protein n=1 Tax=Boletus reticuloceps TaxID=495285 RepID=A0A8I3A6A3_9AGAM|nr:hypothetical protein JVT61DRAFT_6452 [Boletus reticuloceps]
MVVQPSFLLDACMDTQAKKHTKILSKIKSTKNNITKIFKMTGRVSPSLLNICPFALSVRQHCVQEVHQSLSLKSISSPISRSRGTTELDLPSSEQQTRLVATTSLIAYGEHVAKEYVDTFSILRCVIEAPSLSSLAHFLTVPDSSRTPSSTILLNELPTIEEAVWNPVIDAEGVEPKPLIASSPRAPLTTSGSEEKYDAILAAEFANFSFHSNDTREWSDDVEREKQARMDAHFTSVSEALAVPVPRLSAYFTDSPVDFTTVDKDEFISDLFPVKTENSETNTSSADFSLVTRVDAEEDRSQSSLVMLRGLRRVRNYEDLRVRLLLYHHYVSFLTSSVQTLQVIADCSDSFSDLSCYSLDLGPDSIIAEGALRRSVKCNDLRVY